MAIKNIPVDLKTGTPADQEKRDRETFKRHIDFSGSLTVRDRPSEYGKAKWYVSCREPIRVVMADGDFLKIHYGKHQSGYIDSRFLRRC